MADEWTMVRAGKVRFNESRRATDRLWSQLTTHLVLDCPMDEGLAVANHLLDDLDRLFCEVIASLQRGADILLARRAVESIRMKRRVHTLRERYAHTISGGVTMIQLVREGLNDVADCRSMLQHADQIHRQVLAS